MAEFAEFFEELTGYKPFPWQQRLFTRMLAGDFPETCTLPTGLGKTSIIAIWLLALVHEPARVPRRLVYVVNRRTVVDQATAEAENLRNSLQRIVSIRERLSSLSSSAGIPLAISTLRGQFADNGEWLEDPGRPAIILGTVDMVGSRLLFSGYGAGFKTRPAHAGFLGQDSLIVHDEAQLEPAFQSLLEEVRAEQLRCGDLFPIRVMALTATPRALQEPFTLDGNDLANTEIQARVHASKQLVLHPIEDEKEFAKKIAEKAIEVAGKSNAVLVFARGVDTVSAIQRALIKAKETTLVLTGTMRGKEREELTARPEFKRFLKDATPGEKPVFLVCTSAGEVGVNMSGDALVCDLSTFDAMAQRFGRVNRFGKKNATIDVFHPVEFGKKKKDGTVQLGAFDLALQKTLVQLRELGLDASPAGIGKLPIAERLEAFSPAPEMLPVTDIHFNSWALTTVRGRMPGRQPVEPYLHGVSEWQPPETWVAWREEVGIITADLMNAYPPEELLEDYPLKPRELLRDSSTRIFDNLKKLAAKNDGPVWLLHSDGTVEPKTLAELVEDDITAIENITVLLSTAIGGLDDDGILDPSSESASDVADEVGERVRVWSDDPARESKIAGLRLIRSVGVEDGNDDESPARTWDWYEKRNQGGRTASAPVSLAEHVADVESHARRFAEKLPLKEYQKKALILAAKFHDSGKKRMLFQRMMGNEHYPDKVLAKSGRMGGRLVEPYRHELGSLLDMAGHPEAEAQEEDVLELARHLVAAHHGRARPHFPANEQRDPEHPTIAAEKESTSTALRFAALQSRFGRWGLAYLESILRAADWAASGNPSSPKETE